MVKWDITSPLELLKTGDTRLENEQTVVAKQLHTDQRQHQKKPPSQPAIPTSLAMPLK